MTQAQNLHQIKVDRLQDAHDIARSAGVKNLPGYTALSFRVTRTFRHFGSGGMERKLAIEKSITGPSQLSADLQNRRQCIEVLINLEIVALTVEWFK